MTLYTNILVPTDGSKLSAKAVKTAVQLAGSLGARVTGAYVIPPYVPPVYMEGMAYGVVTPASHREAAKRAGKKALAEIEIRARVANVPYAPVMLPAETPWEGILKIAKQKRCDGSFTNSRNGLNSSARKCGSKRSGKRKRR